VILSTDVLQSIRGGSPATEFRLRSQPPANVFHDAGERHYVGNAAVLRETKRQKARGRIDPERRVPDRAGL
jgi:hypothetical protein